MRLWASTFSIFRKTSIFFFFAHWENAPREITSACVSEDIFPACTGFQWSILSAGPWIPQSRQKPPFPLETELRNTPSVDHFTRQCDGLSCLFLLWAELSRRKISRQPKHTSSYIAMGGLLWIIVCMDQECLALPVKHGCGILGRRCLIFAD